MDKKKILAIAIAIWLSGLLIGKWLESARYTNKLKPHDVIVIDSFRIGCEFGVLKNCTPGQEQNCKLFCSEIITKNKDLIDLLKNKKE